MSSHSHIAKASRSTPQPGFTTFAEIDKSKLFENIRILQKQAGHIEIMAVVKADAYGHGVASMSKLFTKAGITRFMVATLDEAIQLRSIVPHAQILVASPPHAENLPVYQDLSLDASVTSASAAAELLAAAGQGLKINLHAKIDTGMNRLGIAIDDANDVIQQLLASPNIELAGIWSHLATAGAENKSFARNQIAEAYKIVNQHPSFKGYFHVGNSGTLLNLRDDIGRRDKELVRLGGALLGIPASKRLAQNFGLQAVMSLKSKVIHVNSIKAGDSVSYGRLWRAEQDTQVAVIGAGYADGYPSALHQEGSVLINQTAYPIAGRVCMDMFMIDIGLSNKRVNPGDDVVLFGQGHQSIYDLAALAGLVHYEICCRIPMRVPRHYV